MNKRDDDKERDDIAYSRAGEGDDERAADQWNDKWVSEFWNKFVKELDKDKWTHDGQSNK